MCVCIIPTTFSHEFPDLLSSAHGSTQCPKQLRPASLVVVAVARPAAVPTGNIADALGHMFPKEKELWGYHTS